MIPITKDEAIFLRNQKRVHCHVSRPTRNKKYFLAEEPAALRMLELYRKNKNK